MADGVVSGCLSKALVLDLKPTTVWLAVACTGYCQRSPVHLLQAVLQHGTIPFLEEGPVDVNGVVRVDPDQESVEGGVMDLAEGNPVLDDRITIRM